MGLQPMLNFELDLAHPADQDVYISTVDVIFVLQSSITWMNKNPSPEKRLFFCFENFSYMFDQGPGTYILSIYINIF